MELMRGEREKLRVDRINKRVQIPLPSHLFSSTMPWSKGSVKGEDDISQMRTNEVEPILHCPQFC